MPDIIAKDINDYPNGPYPQFILFGDSLTQFSARQDLGDFNLTPALQADFIRRYDVVNRGFSGYNTAHAKLALPKFMPTPEQAKVELMYIFFGANDACLPGGHSQQHVPLEEYAANLNYIVRHPAITAHNPRLILIAPPPVDEHQLEADERSIEWGAQRTAATQRQYAEACIAVGKELDIPVVDLWSAVMKKVGWKSGDPLLGSKDVPRCKAFEDMFYDGLHFYSPTYKVLYDELLVVLGNMTPPIHPEKIPVRLPDWNEAPKAKSG